MLNSNKLASVEREIVEGEQLEVAVLRPATEASEFRGKILLREAHYEMQEKLLHTSYNPEMGNKATSLVFFLSPPHSHICTRPPADCNIFFTTNSYKLFSQFFPEKLNSKLYIRLKPILNNILGKKRCYMQLPLRPGKRKKG